MQYKAKPRWTYTQTEYLRSNCDRMKDEDIARVLNKTLKAVRRKRQELGLAKEEGRGRVQLREAPLGKKVSLPPFIVPIREPAALKNIDVGGYRLPPNAIKE